ncbi:MAG: hypothetical protein IKZ35_05775 [Clostridia bacterium]|nr:hypothetical protein [Clostridia bacterium]
MAEYCLKCWNKINKSNYTEDDYSLSYELELCEGCGKYKRVIVGKKSLLELLIFKLINKFKK